MTRTLSTIVVFAISIFTTTFCFAANEAGTIKTLQGTVTISRADQAITPTVGTIVMSEDVITTGTDGTLGLTLKDGTRLTAGKNSTLKLNEYSYNPTTHNGSIDASLKEGTLAVISGKIAKTSPKTVKFRTQHSIIGVRGTEFIIEAGKTL